MSEQEAELNFNHTNSSGHIVKYVPGSTYRMRNRHRICKPSCYSRKLSVSLLHVCCQISLEARQITYSFNTLSFRAPTFLERFIHYNQQPSTNFKAALRSLHLDLALALDSSSLPSWQRAFTQLLHQAPLIEEFGLNLDIAAIWGDTRTRNNALQETKMREVADTISILKPMPLIVHDNVGLRFFRE